MVEWMKSLEKNCASLMLPISLKHASSLGVDHETPIFEMHSFESHGASYCSLG